MLADTSPEAATTGGAELRSFRTNLKDDAAVDSDGDRIPVTEIDPVNPTYDFAGQVALVTGGSSAWAWQLPARSPNQEPRSS